MMTSGPPGYSAAAVNRGSNSSYEFSNSATTNASEFPGGPLSHLSDSVSSLDPLNAMEKSLNEQVSILLSYIL